MASKDHVMTGVKQGFAQAGHGRRDFMSKPAKDDWIVYYSPKDKFEEGEIYQKFTAIGKITDDEPYQPNARKGFKAYRRNVAYITCQDAPIRPLISELSFIKNKERWGLYLLSGFREISQADFDLVKKAMV